MGANMSLNIFMNQMWSKSHFFNRKLTTWSSLASAFNTNSKPRFRSLKPQFLSEKTGLFNYSELLEPNGFYLLKDNAVSKSEVLIQEILSSDRKRKMVVVFDELSDTLCKVADMAEFIRVAHPQEKFAYAAKETSISISNLVEELNTNRELYLKLKEVVEKGDVCPIDDIDDYIANLYLFDFEQSGIHLDKTIREKIVQYNDYILHVGSNFVARTVNARCVLKSQLPESIRDYFADDGETVIIAEVHSESKFASAREVAYKIYLRPEKQQEELLGELLQARQKLAVLCGFPTYAHRAVSGSIAGTPEFIQEFLKLTSEKIKPYALQDFEDLLKLKQELDKNEKSLMPWDIPYLTTQFKRKQYRVQNVDYSTYFSLGACMEGLNYLFNALYNVTLKVVEVTNGEIWHEDIKKLCVIEENKVIGYIYCDFFERPGKKGTDSQFTIQGGRLLSDGTYQTPIVVINLNLPNASVRKPSLLNYYMVDNLFHEMGHAMHSMLARTAYQHVTGTRCATDLAEVPSILMEYFASDPRVVSKFAKHFKTGETIPLTLINQLLGSRKMFSACEMQLQISYAAFDQACHSNDFLGRSTTELFAQIQGIYYSLPHVPNTAWQHRFGHLVGYGAKYYSYLMSRAVASWIWHQCFEDNPFNRKEGERYRKELLSQGASKPPRQLVERFLGTEVTPETLSDALLKDVQSYSKFK